MNPNPKLYPKASNMFLRLTVVCILLALAQSEIITGLIKFLEIM